MLHFTLFYLSMCMRFWKIEVERNLSYLLWWSSKIWHFGSSHPEVFLERGVLKKCSKFTGEHPCRSVIWIKLQSNFIEIAIRRGCFPVNLLHIFRTPFPRNTSGWLLLGVYILFERSFLVVSHCLIKLFHLQQT